ncbi:glutaredoxin family protein [Gryllotalpicola ginsengisoli]|uniref:glutaredoxin family protein n=1 Tax=Gryllotalpicola ginsengisoli TaxID=444608 RepID=UPI000413C8E1|nr:glutaredoxin family protein [Gryllotalpicola ginsengisoli]
MPHRVTLYSKPGCHLCDDARTAIADVIGRLGASVDVDEIDILSDPVLQERYGEEIPVVLIDGKMHTYWRVDQARLEKALKEPR